MANTALNVANVDFTSIKSNLKTYLGAQNLFKDYDFDGSNLSVMLDVLAYNTYMNNFYLNMVAGESFLDSAQLRDSVVSHAKTLNYLPGSYTSSRALVDLQLYPSDTPASITIPKYTAFTSKVESNTYTFTTDEGITIAADSEGNYKTAGLTILEGEIVTELFQVNTSNTAQRYVLSNKEVDVDSLVLTVTSSTTDLSNSQWTKALTTIGIDGGSNTYFVVPAENETYEVQFGDDVLGRAVSHGNVIEARYRKAAANNADGATSFTLSGDIQGYSNVVVSTSSKSTGGGYAETIESIKFNAPKSVTVQDRLVTVGDYQTLLKQEFNDIEALNVYGGEELSPPLFGKVIVAVDLKNADGVSVQRKNEIEKFIKLRAPLSISPKVVQPEFLFVDVITEVIYNPNVTVKSDSEINTAVKVALDNFMASNINKFDATLRMSKLTNAVDLSDASILNNNATFRLQKTLIPSLGKNTSFTLDFDNAIYREIPLSNVFVDGSAPVTSSTFTYISRVGCFLRDNGSGVIQVVQDSSGKVEVVETSIGTVDYDTGKVQITDLNVSAYSGTGITLNAIPSNQTLKSSKNIILKYNDTPSITVTQERV
tara:strand:+ start:5968 stop:7758 length:1791 start_codon:yes stop_codon:yes gene_type:complete